METNKNEYQMCECFAKLLYFIEDIATNNHFYGSFYYPRKKFDDAIDWVNENSNKIDMSDLKKDLEIALFSKYEISQFEIFISNNNPSSRQKFINIFQFNNEPLTFKHLNDSDLFPNEIFTSTLLQTINFVKKNRQSYTKSSFVLFKNYFWNSKKRYTKSNLTDISLISKKDEEGVKIIDPNHMYKKNILLKKCWNEKKYDDMFLQINVILEKQIHKLTKTKHNPRKSLFSELDNWFKKQCWSVDNEMSRHIIKIVESLNWLRNKCGKPEAIQNEENAQKSGLNDFKKLSEDKQHQVARVVLDAFFVVQNFLLLANNLNENNLDSKN